jgi:hypothetical protein
MAPVVIVAPMGLRRGAGVVAVRISWRGDSSREDVDAPRGLVVFGLSARVDAEAPRDLVEFGTVPSEREADGSLLDRALVG